MTKDTECEYCKGTGIEGIFNGNGDGVGDAPCSSCNGTGKVKEQPE